MNKKVTALFFLGCALVVAFIAGRSFLKMYEEEPIATGPGVTRMEWLSDYFPDLKGTRGDTEIYVLEGKAAGGSTLVLGGTHPNESAAFLAAVVLIENAVVDQGTLYVIPRANKSAFTHNDPQEGAPQRFTIETAFGERWFRYGSRATNPIDQWPDPDVYIHAASGQQLSGSETRNLNRGYPGRPDGTQTERVCYGIQSFIRAKEIALTIDLHEASPEYPVINAIVSHENAMPIAAEVAITMQLEGIDIGLEPSPVNLRGLTHRELGDSTDTYAVLMETANPSQGRLRGATNEALVCDGQDVLYVKAAELGRLFVPFDASGHPIEERVARHVEGVRNFIEAMSSMEPAQSMAVKGLPSYEALIEEGVGSFLLPVQ